MIPSPLFNNDRPMYMNFGAGGSYMAMTIAEVLVDLGRNSSGKIREQAECFSHLYDDLDRTKVTNVSLIMDLVGFNWIDLLLVSD